MFHTTTVFTSFGLLYNLCMCKQLKWEMMVASDGTDNTTNNNWQLLTMGCFSINSKRAQQYQPFFFVLAPGERQKIFGMHVVYSWFLGWGCEWCNRIFQWHILYCLSLHQIIDLRHAYQKESISGEGYWCLQQACEHKRIPYWYSNSWRAEPH